MNPIEERVRGLWFIRGVNYETMTEEEKLKAALLLIDDPRNAGVGMDAIFADLVKTLNEGNLDAVVKWLAL